VPVAFRYMVDGVSWSMMSGAIRSPLAIPSSRW